MSQQRVTIYTNQGNTSFFKVLRASLSDLFSSGFLARQIAIRDIKAQYRQSYLGILWAFITPLTTALVWVFLQSTGTVQLTDTGIPYPVYAFSGTLIWSIITGAINAPQMSTSSAKSIISKINFPKEALLLSGIYKLLFNAIPKILLLIILLLIFGVDYQHSAWLFPLVMLGAVFFGFTLGLILTPIGLLYNDISKLIMTGLRFMMYLTPVVYMIPADGIMKTIMEWNPFSPMILLARSVLVGTPSDHLGYYFLVLLCCVPILLIGLVFYRISIPIIVERSSS